MDGWMDSIYSVNLIVLTKCVLELESYPEQLKVWMYLQITGNFKSYLNKVYYFNSAGWRVVGIFIKDSVLSGIRVAKRPTHGGSSWVLLFLCGLSKISKNGVAAWLNFVKSGVGGAFGFKATLEELIGIGRTSLPSVTSLLFSCFYLFWF